MSLSEMYVMSLSEKFAMSLSEICIIEVCQNGHQYYRHDASDEAADETLDEQGCNDDCNDSNDVLCKVVHVSIFNLQYRYVGVSPAIILPPFREGRGGASIFLNHRLELWRDRCGELHWLVGDGVVEAQHVSMQAQSVKW